MGFFDQPRGGMEYSRDYPCCLGGEITEMRDADAEDRITEIVAGFMLLVGIFPALATLFLAPDVVGIVIVNARLMPSFLWLGAVVFLLTAYLGYAYWDRYKSIFSRN